VDGAPANLTEFSAASSSESKVVETNTSKSVIAARRLSASGGSNAASFMMPRNLTYASSRRPRPDKNQQTTSFKV
jgi:hypothetical protein